MILVMLAGVVAFQAWMWNRLSGRIACGGLTKLQGVLRYGLWALLPLLLFVAFSFGAVGLEEWLGVAVISEPMGRATLLIVAFLLVIAGLGSACFSLRCAFIKPAPLLRA